MENFKFSFTYGSDVEKREYLPSKLTCTKNKGRVYTISNHGLVDGHAPALLFALAGLSMSLQF
jgi:hypothetical protein